jgi:hypothetical protein
MAYSEIPGTNIPRKAPLVPAGQENTPDKVTQHLKTMYGQTQICHSLQFRLQLSDFTNDLPWFRASVNH